MFHQLSSPALLALDLVFISVGFVSEILSEPVSGTMNAFITPPDSGWQLQGPQ